MPLSKAKQAEYMKEYRKRLKSVIPNQSCVIPSVSSVIPKTDALRLKSSGIENLLNTTAPPSVKPNVIPKTDVQPNLPIMTQYNFRQFRPGDRVLMRPHTIEI